MKQVFLLLIVLTPAVMFAQNKLTKTKNSNIQTNETTPPKFEPITLYFVMLQKGPDRTQDSATAEKIQEGHMANITKLAAAGKLLVAGPFMDDDDWRGIFIFKTCSLEETEQLVKTDPAIASGRLSYVIHPWMTGKNCLFK